MTGSVDDDTDPNAFKAFSNMFRLGITKLLGMTSILVKPGVTITDVITKVRQGCLSWLQWTIVCRMFATVCPIDGMPDLSAISPLMEVSLVIDYFSSGTEDELKEFDATMTLDMARIKDLLPLESNRTRAHARRYGTGVCVFSCVSPAPAASWRGNIFDKTRLDQSLG